MDRYPLELSIPNTETEKNTLQLRHTTYNVKIDDCGKIYLRPRRYKIFVWLQDELRRKELPCTLPELPPKKTLGLFDEAFVEGRRRLLQEYLRTLLKLPAVVQDESLWTFLDADTATAIVPRFLCRPQAEAAVIDCLGKLEQVLRAPDDIFRLCCPAVSEDFVLFTFKEASEAAVTAGSLEMQTKQQSEARLQKRLRFCSVLQPLLTNEKARTGLAEAGLFSALLAFLVRVTQDFDKAASTGFTPGEVHRLTCIAVTHCLQQLLEGGDGDVLLNYSTQKDGLVSLKQLAGPETVALHPVCSSVIWHSIASADVAAELVSSRAQGLPILGGLLKSPDLRAKLVAGLSVSVLVRTEGLLDAEQAKNCIEAVAGLPPQLDAVESEAFDRTARDAVVAAAEPGDAPASPGPVTVERDRAITSLLSSLCSREKDLKRVLALVGEGPASFDAVTALAVTIISHYVEQSLDDAVRVQDAGGIASRMQQILEESSSDPKAPGVDASQVSDLRARAARVLIHLEWPEAGENAGEALPLEAFAKRAQVMETLGEHTDADQKLATDRFKAAEAEGQGQDKRVQTGSLTDVLKVNDKHLSDHVEYLERLEAQRKMLDDEAQSSYRAAEATQTTLQQRGVNHEALTKSVEELTQNIGEQSSQQVKIEEAQTKIDECSVRLHGATAEAEVQENERDQKEADLRKAKESAVQADEQVTVMQGQEAAAEETNRAAPGRLEDAKAKLVEVEQRRDEVKARGQELSASAKAAENHAVLVNNAHGEAEAALQSAFAVQTELQQLRGKLSSELVLDDAEVERLKDLDLRLKPPRPSRLSSSALDGQSAPDWSDSSAETAFRSTPQARSFSRLVEEKKRLWEAEVRYTEEMGRSAAEQVADYGRQQKTQRAAEQVVQEEEAKLRRDIAEFGDFEGHQRRLAEATERLVEARGLAESRAEEVASVEAALRLAESGLERCRSEVRDAEAALADARSDHAEESEKGRLARAQLEERTADLEEQARSLLEAWRQIELEEHQLRTLQEKVAARLEQEAQVRATVRAESEGLVKKLTELDRQLEVGASAGSPPPVADAGSEATPVVKNSHATWVLPLWPPQLSGNEERRGSRPEWVNEVRQGQDQHIPGELPGAPAKNDAVSEHGSKVTDGPAVSHDVPAPVDPLGQSLERDWFSSLFGFPESSYDEAKKGFRVVPGDGDNKFLQSVKEGTKYAIGSFDCPSLADLRERGAGAALPGQLRVSNELGDVADKHAAPENRFATFQVASQFNCLEFVGPSVIPEDGITGYMNDRTQGPACCIACAPASVFRNYFVPVPAKLWGEPSEGQTRHQMLDTLADMAAVLGNDDDRFFEVRGGYTLASEAQLESLNARIAELEAAPGGLDTLRAALRLGVHADVQVTSTNWGAKILEDEGQLVTQVFAAACAVAYNHETRPESWQRFASIVLEACYEATLWIAVLTASRHGGEEGSRKVFLTCMGGGVFGNHMEWIVQAARRACNRFMSFDLDIRIVTYAGEIHPLLLQLEQDFKV